MSKIVAFWNIMEEIIDKVLTDESSPSLSIKAYDYIIGLILNGGLTPGSVVNEAEVSRALEMSRGPVREAMRRLEGRRLIEREHQQRARVVQLGIKEARDLFELREGLEGMAVRLATQRMSQEDRHHLMQDFEAARDSGAKFDIHTVLARGCGNAQIERAMCEDLYDQLRIHRRWSGARERRSELASDEHWQILRAVELGDQHLAESLMRLHIRRATENLVSLL
jgi:DNA-binding GntR family transcriptional regulator